MYMWYSFYAYIGFWPGKHSKIRKSILFSFFFFLFWPFFLFRASPAAYGSSKTRDWIRTVAAGLYHSHSNSGSKLCLWPTPYSSWQCQFLNPLERTGIDSAFSWILVGWITCWATAGAQSMYLFILEYSLLSQHYDRYFEVCKIKIIPFLCSQKKCLACLMTENECYLILEIHS